jgi:enterochelin esterase-like enzyme
MPAVRLNHPYPTSALPAGLNPDSADSQRRFVRDHPFPAGRDGRFLFGFIDEDQRFDAVRLRHGLAGHRNPPILHRCAGGLHLIELDAPAVNRVEYRFSLMNGDGSQTLIVDPLNPNMVRDPFAERSVVATDAYRPPAYIAPPAPAALGTIEETVIQGPLGKPWQTWIWSPPQHPPLDPPLARTHPLPVILFLDGGDWLQLAGARTILENLAHARLIAPCRAVFVKPAARNEEYAANPRTAGFLAEQLPRALAEHLPWPQDPRHRLAAGVSLGALCLLHAHFTQPSAFGGLILQSGSFFQPHTDAMETGFSHFAPITSFVSRALGSPGREVVRIPIHMTCGKGEENDVNNHIMAEALTRQGFPLTFHEQPDAHNWTCWRDSIGTGLMRLLAP